MSLNLFRTTRARPPLRLGPVLYFLLPLPTYPSLPTVPDGAKSEDLDAVDADEPMVLNQDCRGALFLSYYL